MKELYITFGVQYHREPHPSGAWVNPDGYLTVVYPEGRREDARVAAWTWLHAGMYAFDYDERPSESIYPVGELARMYLP